MDLPSSPSSPRTESIEFPSIPVFENLKNAKGFALDIGGSLTKLAYYTTIQCKRAIITESNKVESHLYKVEDDEETVDCLQFMRFDTALIEECIHFLKREHLIASEDIMKDKVIKVTGGGAYRYKDYLERTLGIGVDKSDEMRCLARGCSFLLRNINDESFEYDAASPRFRSVDDAGIFPYLLVNIGSGVSIIKVISEDECERVGGTSMGGGSFLGLGSMLTSAKSFDELLRLADAGDNRNIDMLVRDIYGGNYDQLQLPGELIACSFGKAATRRNAGACRQGETFRDADIAKSLLVAIANDIGQLACLYARLAGINRIYFGGYFLRGRDITMYCMDYAVRFWSKGGMQALFLRHEGYLGAIGAFLDGVHDQEYNKYMWSMPKWTENYARSLRISTDDRDRCMVDIFEMNRCSRPLVHCPLLEDMDSYTPDTIDLCKDHEARRYWIQCFVNSTDSYVEKAVQSQANSQHAKDRAIKVKRKFVNRLSELLRQPSAYGSLSVRSLLDTREQTLQEFHFTDAYIQQKQSENEDALRLLPGRMRVLDEMSFDERQLALITGLLAGNVFDWGAKKIVSLFESSSGLSFEEALSYVKGRPWLVDDYDLWRSKLRCIGDGCGFQCVAIFVDNSGYDLVLGVFPLVREFVQMGTKVILCANSQPALNDVTYNELTIVMKRFAALCPIIEHALHHDVLFIMENGHSSPCLDLRYIDYDLSRMFVKQEVDLVILEGMGRAVHTNLNAKFKCDSLKIAVLKNEWLAKRLGGQMFSVICKYEPKD